MDSERRKIMKSRSKRNRDRQQQLTSTPKRPLSSDQNCADGLNGNKDTHKNKSCFVSNVTMSLSTPNGAESAEAHSKKEECLTQTVLRGSTKKIFEGNQPKVGNEVRMSNVSGQMTCTIPLMQNHMSPTPYASSMLNETIPTGQAPSPLMQSHIPLSAQAPSVSNETLPTMSPKAPMPNQMPGMGNHFGLKQDQIPMIGNPLQSMSSQMPMSGTQFPFIPNQMPTIGNQIPFMQNQMHMLGNHAPFMQNQPFNVNPFVLSNPMSNVFPGMESSGTQPSFLNMGYGGMGMPTLQPLQVQQQQYAFLQQQWLLNQQMQMQMQGNVQMQFMSPSSPWEFQSARAPSGKGSTKKQKNGKKSKKKRPAPLRCDSSTSDLSSKSDSDTESEKDRVTKRGRSMRMSNHGFQASTDFNNPNATGNAEAVSSSVGNPKDSPAQAELGEDTGHGNEYMEMARAYQANNPNMVWAQVVQEELIEEAAKEMDVVTVTDKFVILRGCESYVVGNKRKRKLLESLPESKVNLSDEEVSSSYSSFSDADGISDYSSAKLREQLLAKRLAKSRLPKTANEQDDPAHAENNTEMEHLESLTTPKHPKVKSGQQLLEEKLATLEEYKVPVYLARKLNEGNMDPFMRTWRIFGMECLLEKFRKTLKVERLGGIMIKNKTRRRTPGGVFLYLLRNDTRLEQAKRDEVFRPMHEKNKVARDSNKRLQAQNLFGKMSRRLKGGEEPKVGGDPADDHEAEFEKDSYIVPMKEEVQRAVVAKKKEPEESVMDMDETQPQAAVSVPATGVPNPGIVSYEDLGMFEDSTIVVAPAQRYENFYEVDLRPYGV